MNDLSVQTLGRGAGLSRADLPRDIPRETNGIAHAIHSRNTHPSYTDDALLLLQSFSLLSSFQQKSPDSITTTLHFPDCLAKKKKIEVQEKIFSESFFKRVVVVCRQL
jgi:hypothetical protein